MAEKYVLMLVNDRDDQLFTESVMSEAGIDIPLVSYSDSNLFLDHLAKAELPALIIVDYNAHPENGPQIVRKLKSDNNSADIPVVILSETDLPRYRSEAYRAGANSFICKPATIEKSNFKIQTFFNYWFSVAGV